MTYAVSVTHNLHLQSSEAPCTVFTTVFSPVSPAFCLSACQGWTSRWRLGPAECPRSAGAEQLSTSALRTYHYTPCSSSTANCLEPPGYINPTQNYLVSADNQFWQIQQWRSLRDCMANSLAVKSSRRSPVHVLWCLSQPLLPIPRWLFSYIWIKTQCVL